MKFREKASAIVLATILMASAVVPVNALMQTQIVGSNRYETAGKVADNMGDYSKAILVNGDSIADGLSASGLAGKENAPILLVKKDSIPKETLRRLYGVKKVYIIGKEGAISSRVESSLNQSGISVKRIGGDDRIGTSLEVSREIGSYSKAFLVNGKKGEADAMSVASVAAKEGAPIILTNGKDKPTYKKSGVKYYVVGGTTVMTNSLQTAFSAERLSGSNRYATNKVIVKKFYPNTDKLYFAKGDSLVDALTVSPLAKNSGLALVSENSDKSVFSGMDTIVQVGGMSSSIVDKVFKATFEDSAKPDEEKPNTDEQQKPDDGGSAKPENPQPGPTPMPPAEDTQKPSEKTYDINSAEFQKIVRDEFYRLLDAYRASKGKCKTVYHWAFEESAMIKSKHMIDNNYFGHGWNGDTSMSYPHVMGGAENIAGQWLEGDVTAQAGKDLANRLFNQWKNSTKGHNEMMLNDYSDPVDNWIDMGGFAFYAKPSYYGESFGEISRRGSNQIYMIKATYHHGPSGYLKNINEPSVELTSLK